jgi:hypothetical protein
MPVTTPRKNARRSVVFGSATSSGASAIQANAGWPSVGKLSARRIPDAAASA